MNRIVIEPEPDEDDSTEMTDLVFISYRRDDAAPEAQLLATILQASMGTVTPFLDCSTVEPGAKWTARIEVALRRSRYVLAVVGPLWLGEVEEGKRRRIDDPEDWVRKEISAALRDPAKVVIPVLVRGAQVPPSATLPDDIRDLPLRQAVELRRNYWNHDVKLLLASIGSSETVSHSTPQPSAKMADPSPAPETKELVALMEYRGEKIATLLKHHKSELQRFMSLHTRHLDSLRRGDLVAGHEVLTDIYACLRSIPITYDNGILYSAKEPVQHPCRSNVLNYIYGEEMPLHTKGAQMPDTAADVVLTIEKVNDSSSEALIRTVIRDSGKSRAQMILSILFRMVDSPESYEQFFAPRIVTDWQREGIPYIRIADRGCVSAEKAFWCLHEIHQASKGSVPSNWNRVLLRWCMNRHVRSQAVDALQGLVARDERVLYGFPLTPSELAGVVRALTCSDIKVRLSLIRRLSREPLELIKGAIHCTEDDLEYYKDHLYSEVFFAFSESLGAAELDVAIFSSIILTDLDPMRGTEHLCYKVNELVNSLLVAYRRRDGEPHQAKIRSVAVNILKFLIPALAQGVNGQGHFAPYRPKGALHAIAKVDFGNALDGLIDISLRRRFGRWLRRTFKRFGEVLGISCFVLGPTAFLSVCIV
jgi:hypothetical protein